MTRRPSKVIHTAPGEPGSDLYSQREELAHVITHAAGILFSLLGTVLLVFKARMYGDNWHMTGFIVFGVALLLLYTSSTLYHLVRDKKKKTYFRKLDHSAIYILIAGTYTPFLLTNLRGTAGWIMLVIVWTFALIGITLKIATQIRSKWISAVIYLVMGWLAVFIARSMIQNLNHLSLIFLLAGGLFYTFGVLFYIWKKLPYHHAIWHLFVLAGSVCHFLSIYYIL